MKLQPSLEKKHFGKSFCFKKAKKVIKKNTLVERNLESKKSRRSCNNGCYWVSIG
jgi:hypothetical protein